MLWRIVAVRSRWVWHQLNKLFFYLSKRLPEHLMGNGVHVCILLLLFISLLLHGTADIQKYQSDLTSKDSSLVWKTLHYKLCAAKHHLSQSIWLLGSSSWLLNPAKLSAHANFHASITKTRITVSLLQSPHASALCCLVPHTTSFVFLGITTFRLSFYKLDTKLWTILHFRLLTFEHFKKKKSKPIV